MENSSDISAVGACEETTQRSDSAVNEFFEAAIPEDKVFCIIPKTDCPHLNSLGPVPSTIDTHAPCQTCKDVKENWICLICYEVYCGRYVNKHMLKHSETSGHLIALSFSDLSAWCYGCECYVHNPLLLMAKRLAHKSKFGSDLPAAAE